jgi:hypothetical protein
MKKAVISFFRSFLAIGMTFLLLTAVSFAVRANAAKPLTVEECTKELEVRERTLGPAHPDTLTSRHNLAKAYQNSGNYAKAKELNEQVLKARERTLGPEHLTCPVFLYQVKS